MKTSIVTGCAGFIGSHMVDYLIKKNHKVIGIDNCVSGKIVNIQKHLKNKNFIFYKKNIGEIKNFFKFEKKINYIFHFAGNGELIPSIENPYEYFENNAINTLKLIEFVRKKINKIDKFIYAASSTCYGLIEKKTKENDKINIQHPYAFSKYIGEQSVLHWGKVYNLPIISIRIFNAYGPRSRTNNAYGAVMGVFLKQKIQNHPLTIVGNGLQKRDFLYVADLCDAFYKAAISNKKNQIYNLGYGQPKKIIDLAKMISNQFIFMPWRPGEPKKTHANIKKIQKDLKWKPTINLKKGVTLILKNIKYWKKAPLWTPKKIRNATKNWNKLLKNAKY